MKKLTFLFTASFFIFFMQACSKKSNAVLPPNNNEVNATVVLSTGFTININAKGLKAPIGLYGIFGGPGYVDGTNAANAAVLIEVYSAISGPGTYDLSHGFRCQYRQDVTNNSTPIYQNNGANAGSITFTTANENNAEGYFNAVCRLNTDSVIVSGTFKGDHITH